MCVCVGGGGGGKGDGGAIIPKKENHITTKLRYIWRFNTLKTVHRTEKKMADVYFTTIPCEPNAANRHT